MWKWNLYWWSLSVSSITIDNKIYLLRSGRDTTPYIEVWEITGDLSDPIYQVTIMNNTDGLQFSSDILREKLFASKMINTNDHIR